MHIAKVLGTNELFEYINKSWTHASMSFSGGTARSAANSSCTRRSITCSGLARGARPARQNAALRPRQANHRTRGHGATFDIDLWILHFLKSRLYWKFQEDMIVLRTTFSYVICQIVVIENLRSKLNSLISGFQWLWLLINLGVHSTFLVNRTVYIRTWRTNIVQ